MTAQLTDTGEIDMGSVKDLKLPPPDTHCLDDEGVRPIDVWSYSPELVRQIIAADRALQSARHREELLAYEVTVGNLRADIALTCDFCGCETPDPWHGNTATNRHVHACDACKPKLAPAWHDKPTAPGLWVVGSRCLHINELDLPIYKDSHCRWYGPIPEDKP